MLKIIVRNWSCILIFMIIMVLVNRLPIGSQLKDILYLVTGLTTIIALLIRHSGTSSKKEDKDNDKDEDESEELVN